MDAVDTNVLVRYFLQDDPEQGRAATKLVDSEKKLGISLVALAETAFVLSRNYHVPREEVVDQLVELLRRRNIDVFGVDKNLAASALILCRPSGRVNYADALINADARANAVDKLHTFDERFPSEGLEIMRPD